jgi:hypothetical protein
MNRLTTCDHASLRLRIHPRIAYGVQHMVGQG